MSKKISWDHWIDSVLKGREKIKVNQDSFNTLLFEAFHANDSYIKSLENNIKMYREELKRCNGEKSHETIYGVRRFCTGISIHPVMKIKDDLKSIYVDGMYFGDFDGSEDFIISGLPLDIHEIVMVPKDFKYNWDKDEVTWVTSFGIPESVTQVTKGMVNR